MNTAKKTSKIKSKNISIKNRRKTPISEEELDYLAESFLEHNDDLPVVQMLIEELGEERAKERIKDGYRAMDPNSPYVM
ncbi:MAG: hypothetical protein MUC95_05645 [Spirochaetes bacterium]|nr:hypothetical protein [Spirochaetota bacterium]